MRWLDSITSAMLFAQCELGKTLGGGEGQGCLAGCSPWGHKELDMTGQLNNEQQQGPGKLENESILFSTIFFLFHFSRFYLAAHSENTEHLQICFFNFCDVFLYRKTLKPKGDL